MLLDSFRFRLNEKRIRQQTQEREALLKKFLWIPDPVEFVILRSPRNHAAVPRDDKIKGARAQPSLRSALRVERGRLEP
jgi:hypothetical protein